MTRRHLLPVEADTYRRSPEDLRASLAAGCERRGNTFATIGVSR